MIVALLRRVLGRLFPAPSDALVIHAGREICAGCDRIRDPAFVPPKFTVEEATRRFNTGSVLGVAA